MKVLITGGAGFIGSNFVRMVFDKSFPAISSVVVLDKLTYAGNKENLGTVKDQPNYRFLQGDICDSNLVHSLLDDVDAVINFAAESHVDHSIESSDVFIKTNIQGTHNLLNLAVKYGVSKYLQVSTDEVYGSISEGSWDESFPLLFLARFLGGLFLVCQSLCYLLHGDAFPVCITMILERDLVGMFVEVYFKRAGFLFDAVVFRPVIKTDLFIFSKVLPVRITKFSGLELYIFAIHQCLHQWQK